MQEETFAPVIPLIRFHTEAEAITSANATPYGLAAYAFTTNLARSWRLAEQLAAGTIGISDSPAGRLPEDPSAAAPAA